MPVPTFPYNLARDITKSDTIDFVDGPCDAIYAGGAGVVAVVMAGGSVNNFTVTAATLLPVKAKRVNSTNTTATLMIALYQT